MCKTQDGQGHADRVFGEPSLEIDGSWPEERKVAENRIRPTAAPGLSERAGFACSLPGIAAWQAGLLNPSV
jgi:hypothetical protein